MAGRDNHDKEMLRTLKRIATALEKIEQNTGPKNRTIEISLDWNNSQYQQPEPFSNYETTPNMIKRLGKEAKKIEREEKENDM